MKVVCYCLDTLIKGFSIVPRSHLLKLLLKVPVAFSLVATLSLFGLVGIGAMNGYPQWNFGRIPLSMWRTELASRPPLLRNQVMSELSSGGVMRTQSPESFFFGKLSSKLTSGPSDSSQPFKNPGPAVASPVSPWPPLWGNIVSTAKYAFSGTIGDDLFGGGSLWIGAPDSLAQAIIQAPSPPDQPIYPSFSGPDVQLSLLPLDSGPLSPSLPEGLGQSPPSVVSSVQEPSGLALLAVALLGLLILTRRRFHGKCSGFQ